MFSAPGKSLEIEVDCGLLSHVSTRQQGIQLIILCSRRVPMNPLFSNRKAPARHLFAEGALMQTSQPTIIPTSSDGKVPSEHLTAALFFF